MQTRYSVSAERVAAVRAVHQVKDHRPLVFEDDLALRILGASGPKLLEKHIAEDDYEGLRRARTAVIVRSRFAEDELERAVADGARQYVILGAGLDTFAYRRTELADRLTVFEVDHPVTQGWKRERLAEAGIAVPANVRYVGLDFNERPLAESLAEAGFRRDLPTIFSWLGVMYYLPRQAIVDTLRFMGAQAAPVTAVFDYAVAEQAIPPQFLPFVRNFLAYNRRAEERWISFFVPDEVLSLVRDCGFTEIDHLDFNDLERRYLSGRDDGLLSGPLIALIAARRRAA